MYLVVCFSFTLLSCNSFHLENQASVSRRLVCRWVALAGECGPRLPLQMSTTSFQCSQKSATWLYMPLLFRLNMTPSSATSPRSAAIRAALQASHSSKNRHFYRSAEKWACNSEVVQSQTSSIICIFNGTLPYIELRFELFKDDSSRDVTNIFREMRHVRQIYNPLLRETLTSKSTLEYLSKISHCNASWNVCVDRVSQNDTRLVLILAEALCYISYFFWYIPTRV